MKKKIKKILLLLSIILFTTCDYEFSEDYYKEIVVTEPIVSISLINLKENDTLIKPRQIDYNYEASDKNLLYQINFYLDNKVIYQSSNKVGNFPLEIKNLSNGSHILKIEYIFRLGSESLVDLLGNELVKKEEEVSFEVNNNIPIDIKEIKIIDGSIYVYFEPYILIDDITSSTEISLISESEYGSLSFKLSKYHLINGFYDYRNFGTNISYHTKVKNTYSETNSAIKVLKVDNNFKVDVNVKNTDETIISWTKHPVYNTFNAVVNIENTEHRFNQSIPIDIKTDGQKTIVLGQFGRIYQYKVQHRKSGYNNYSSPIFQGEVNLGSRFEAPKNGFTKIIHSKQNNRFYALSIEQINENSPESNVYIYELESDNLKTIKKTKITTSTNIYGDLIKDSSGNLIIDLNSKSIVIDINSLSVLEEYSISEYSNNYDHSDIISYRDNFLFKNKKYGIKEIFDTSTKKKIISFTETGRLFITKNGKYFSFKNKIYKIENSTITEVIESPMQGSPVVIKGLDIDIQNNKLYFLSGYDGSITSVLYEYDLSTKTSKKIPSLPIYISSFHFSSDEQKLICEYSDYNKTELYILDINSNQIKSINANISSSFLVIKDNLISSSGTYLNNFF